MKKTIQKIRKVIFSAILSLLAINATAQNTEVFVQLGHSDLISSVAFSPDGQYILSGSQDKTVRLWEVSSGREIHTFTGHTGPVTSVAFSPDGRHALSGSADDTAKLWKIATGREVRTFSGHSGGISSVAFSPDGRYALSGSGDNTLKLWEVSTGREVRSLTGHTGIVPGKVSSVAFSPDGRYMLSGSGTYNKGTIKLWEVTTGREVRTFTGHTKKVTGVAFSPDGQRALSGSEDGTAKLWDVTTGREIRSFFVNQYGVTSVAFSPDGQYALIAESTGLGTFKLWEVATGRKVRAIDPYPGGHKDVTNSVAFSPDGQYAISGSGDKTIKLWEVSTGKEIRTFAGQAKSVTNIARSPNGRYIVSGGADKTILWEVSTGRQVRTFNMDDNSGSNIVFSGDGRHVLTGSAEGAKLWEVSTGKEIRTFTGHYVIHSVAFSPDGRYVLSGGFEKTLKLWKASNGREVRTFTGHLGEINSVAFSPDGRYILSGAGLISGTRYDSAVRLWEVSSGREIHTFTGHTGSVTSVAFSPDGRYALSGSTDDTAKLWEISTGREVRTFSGHDNNVKFVAFSPDGKYALSGGPGGLFESGNNAFKLWEVSTGRELRTFTGHSDGVWSVAFSPDGEYIYSASLDRTLRVWQTDTGRELAKMVSFSNDEWLVITPEGYYNASKNGAQFLNVRIGNNVFPMDNFFSTYYRPDIVRAKLAGEDISGMIDADIRKLTTLPPAVRFLTPENYTTSTAKQLTLTAEVTDRGGGIGEVRLTHNGKTISSDTRGLKMVSTEGRSVTRKFTVNLLPGQNTFELIALSTGQRIESNPARLVISYEGAVATSDLYVLAVGLNEYKNASLNLNYGRPDAEAFVEAVRSQSAGIFKSVNVKTLYDGQATRVNLLAAFEVIITKARPQDAFLLFYAGHGVMSEPEGREQGDFYMALHETIRLYGNNSGLAAYGISASEMTELTRRIAARKQMIVLDACQSGGAVQTFAMRGAAEQKAILQLARSAGLVVMASTGTEQYATEFQALGHGVFTYALLNGLSGKADGGSRDGKITVKELEAFINDRVPALTRKHRGQAQYPNSYARGQDFPISIVIE